MSKMLNITAIKDRMERMGISAADMSRKLSVSRETVSQWLSEENFPRPAKLIAIAKLLGFKFDDIVISANFVNEPVIAFRKTAHSVTKDKHLSRAKETGYALEKLVPHLKFSTITKPVSLNNPVLDYRYVQTAVREVRKKINISQITVEAADITRFFSESNTLLIPVLLGTKQNHENALHIYLPESATNWVFVNLDSNILDFKFWLIHELSHVLTPGLTGDAAEDFSDAFAGAFLFPEELASDLYKKLSAALTDNNKLRLIISESKRYSIAPYTVYKEVNKYALHNRLSIHNFEKLLFAGSSGFLKKVGTVSKMLFGGKSPNIPEFISVTTRELHTPFFDILKSYLLNSGVSSSYIRALLNLSAADSIALFNYLKYGVSTDSD